jgi:hypothetical protein
VEPTVKEKSQRNRKVRLRGSTNVHESFRSVYADGMAKKSRIPDAKTVGRCDKCGRSIGGKGYYGPECQCAVALSKASGRSHSIGIATKKTGQG